MTAERIHENPEIYRIKIPLTGNPLRNLNCYVVLSKGEALVIDTGFGKEECRRALKNGIEELGIPIEKTRLFITHMHSDHSGAADIFLDAGRPVYMSGTDLIWLAKSADGRGRSYWNTRYRENGCPEEILRHSDMENPIYEISKKDPKRIIPVTDYTKLEVGSIWLECLMTPGHTPGHTCLYLKEKGILFAGDHILYDITPNIGVWEGVEDSLGDYLDSLKKIDKLPFKTAYPAHREIRQDPHERIRELLKHHQQRLREVLKIIEKEPGLNAYEITSRMKWSIRCRDWSDFPKNQKWFAMGEALAHLDWLRKQNYVKHIFKDGILKFYPSEKPHKIIV